MGVERKPLWGKQPQTLNRCFKLRDRHQPTGPRIRRTYSRRRDW
jgi:hypothetical protein